MPQIGEQYVGGVEISGGLLRDPPTVVVTAPDGPVATQTTTVTWTYSSALSKPQAWHRIDVLNADGSGLLFSSGNIDGTATSYDCPFILSGGSTYRIRVTASDAVDEGSDFIQFLASVSAVSSFGTNQGVGTVYEAAINGEGLMLADSDQTPYRRQVGTLQAPRLAVGDTPFSEAIERYTYIGQGDWSGGAGQETGSRALSDPTAFSSSRSVDPFTPGELQLLPTTDQEVASATDPVRAVVASGKLFAQSASDTFRSLDEPGDGSPGTLTFTNDVVDITSDGTYWYAADGTAVGIRRGTGTVEGSVWSDLSTPASTLDLVEWTSDRLTVIYTNSSSQSVLSTIGPDGSEEVGDGRFKFDDGVITAVTAGDGYLWFSVNRTDRSVIYAWQLGSNDAEFVALELPPGQSVTALFHYLGNVLVRTAESVDATTVHGLIYRAIPSEGTLTPELVTRLEVDAVDQGPGSFTGDDRFVFFSYTAGDDDGRSCIGALDLSTGGWCRWLRAPVGGATGVVSDLVRWTGRVGFTVDEYGTVVESTDLESSGYLISSRSDLASSLEKVLDDITIATEPLGADASITVDVSLDGGTSWITAGQMDVPGLKTGRWTVGFQTSSISTRLILNAAGSVSPVVSMLQTKVHPLSITDSILELPVNCSYRLVGLNGLEIQDGVPSGLARVRRLEALVGTRVVVQDVDWPITGTASTWEVVSADTTSTGVYSRNLGHRVEQEAVCVLTLRRAV